mgnify:CR=1 FL=1
MEVPRLRRELQNIEVRVVCSSVEHVVVSCYNLFEVQVDEKVLAEVLELPAWMHIDSALCTRVAVNVPWTRLKSASLQLVNSRIDAKHRQGCGHLQFIDEIRVFVSLSAEYFAAQQPATSTKKDKERSTAASSFAYVARR